MARDGVIQFNNMIREKIPLDKLVVFFDVMKEINGWLKKKTSKSKLANQRSCLWTNDADNECYPRIILLRTD